MDDDILLKGKNKPFVYKRIHRCDICVFDNDSMMSCADRICAECGNNHGFTGNFADVVTSIDVLSNLFSKDLKRNIKSEVFLN
jgi:hypothetical protein